MAALVDWNDPASWTTWYGAGRDGVRVGYGRDWATGFGAHPLDQGKFARQADWLIALGMAPTDKILIAGCGFGFGIEVLQGRGFTETYGIDSSTDIASKRGIETDGDVLFVEDDMTGGGQVRGALRSMAGLGGGEGFDWVISEDALSTWEDSDLPPLLGAAEAILDSAHDNDHIVHMMKLPPFSPAFQGILNEKTLAEWAVFAPDHTWMDLADGSTL